MNFFITYEFYIVEKPIILIKYNYEYAPNSSTCYPICYHLVVINISYVYIWLGWVNLRQIINIIKTDVKLHQIHLEYGRSHSKSIE